MFPLFQNDTTTESHLTKIIKTQELTEKKIADKFSIIYSELNTLDVRISKIMQSITQLSFRLSEIHKIDDEYVEDISFNKEFIPSLTLSDLDEDISDVDSNRSDEIESISDDICVVDQIYNPNTLESIKRKTKNKINSAISSSYSAQKIEL